MKSTLVNMTAVLFGITLVASAGVGAVNMITAEPIAQAEQAAKVEALKVVLPPFDQTAPEALTIDDMPITVYTATKGGQVAGYAVESMTKNGFGGAIFGISLGTADYMPLIFVLAPGAFLVLGYLMVLFNKLAKK